MTKDDLVRPEDTTPEHAAACLEVWTSANMAFMLGPMLGFGAVEAIDLHGTAGFLLKLVAIPFVLYALSMGRSRLRRPANAVALLALLLSAACLSAAELVEDWPQFLGPRGNNTSRETGLLDKFPKDGPPLVWQRDIGTGYSAPSVRGELLVLHHRVKDEEVVEAMHPATGKPAWRTPLIDLPSWSGSIVTAGGLVFTGNALGEFAALDEATGQVLWKFKTPSGVNSQPITYTYKGKQYVSVLSGLGGGASSRRETAGKVLPGGTVWTFALQ